MKDPLGTRMKEQYEYRTRYFVPRRTFTILRLDGKAFHTYTKNLNKPFDKNLYKDIDRSIEVILQEIQGSVFAYTQSDEISILLTDFRTPTTEAWFDGNIQKMTSVAASILTSEFNRNRISRFMWDGWKKGSAFLSPDDAFIPPAYFDCRVFTIPDRVEVMNYFRWRQQDCIRNSVSMVAQSKFSHKELNGKSQSEMHEMLHNVGVNWATDYTDGEKNGRLIVREKYQTTDNSNNSVERTRWDSKNSWVFTKDEGKLLNLIPNYDCP